MIEFARCSNTTGILSLIIQNTLSLYGDKISTPKISVRRKTWLWAEAEVVQVIHCEAEKGRVQIQFPKKDTLAFFLFFPRILVLWGILVFEFCKLASRRFLTLVVSGQDEAEGIKMRHGLLAECHSLRIQFLSVWDVSGRSLWISHVTSMPAIRKLDTVKISIFQDVV